MAAKRKGPQAGAPRTLRPSASSSPSGFTYGKTSLDVGALREIVELLEGTEVTRLSWTNGDERLYIRRGPETGTTVVHTAAPVVHHSTALQAEVHAPAPAGHGHAPAAAPAPAEKPGQLVTSPFVGTFYSSPAPDQPPFVELNSNVRKGQVLCIVEAMKLMNEIESELAGRVTEILVENGQPVEYGQALFRIETA